MHVHHAHMRMSINRTGIKFAVHDENACTIQDSNACTAHHVCERERVCVCERERDEERDEERERETERRERDFIRGRTHTRTYSEVGPVRLVSKGAE